MVVISNYLLPVALDSLPLLVFSFLSTTFFFLRIQCFQAVADLKGQENGLEKFIS